MEEAQEGNIKFTQGGITTADKVVEKALVHLLEESRTVESPVSLAAIYISFLAGYAAASIQVMDHAPDWLTADPGEGLTIMANSLRDDLFSRHNDIEWLQDVIATEGFVGWAFVLQGETDAGPARIVIFYSRVQGVFTAWEGSDTDEMRTSWVPEAAVGDHAAGPEIQSLITFTELTHFARIRWEQYGVSVCEGPKGTPSDN
jgi:hypothetical protein